MSKSFQDGLNGVMASFAQGVADECHDHMTARKEDIECGVAAALINAAANIMLRNGCQESEVLEVVRQHLSELRSSRAQAKSAPGNEVH